MEMKTSDASKGKLRSTYIVILIPLGIAINFIGGQIAGKLALPLYLDSIGTSIVAAIMGPWIGAASGVLYNIIASIINGNIMGSLFGLANIATALIIGYMVKFDRFKKWYDVLIAVVAVAIANALIGAPIAVVVYGGIQGSGVDLLVAGLLSFGRDILSATFLARIPVNLVDKGISTVVAWVILRRLPDNMQSLSGKKISMKKEGKK